LPLLSVNRLRRDEASHGTSDVDQQSELQEES
jgi:hypothetical protein